MSEFDTDANDVPPPPEPRPKTYFEKFFCAVHCALSRPVEVLHDAFVAPDRQVYEWYHQKFVRVPNIDECYEDDPVCFAEANMQYKRDRLVDSEIIGILRQRFENCIMYETPHHLERCQQVLKDYETASTNWFIKYGDLGGYHNVRTCYMKQKHRLIWERRFGKIGGVVDGDDDEDDAAGENDPCKQKPEKKGK